MKRFNHFLYGLIPGLLLPIGFMWVYLHQFYPGNYSFLETLKQLYPGVLLGKLLLLSVMPNLLLVFVFYKSDSFKIATGVLIGGMPYFISSIFML